MDMHWQAVIPAILGFFIVIVAGYGVVVNARRQRINDTKKLTHHVSPSSPPPITIAPSGDRASGITMPELRAFNAIRAHKKSNDPLADHDLDNTLISLASCSLRVYINKVRHDRRPGMEAWWDTPKQVLFDSLITCVEKEDMVGVLASASMIYVRDLEQDFKSKKLEQIKQAHSEALKAAEDEVGE